VWYLDKADSICPGCSRGCNISVHTNTIRPWHNDGKRVARLKPRLNHEVNGYWMCDDGRYGFGDLDQDRLGRVLRVIPQKQDISWETAAEEISARLTDARVVASGMLSNEDWAALKDLFPSAPLYFSAEPDQIGIEDDLLRRREKVPNLKGAENMGLKSGSFDALAADIEAGKVKSLYVIERDLAKVWGLDKAKALLAKVPFTVLQGPNKGPLGDLFHYRLPATAYVEETGHFTNFQGKVQQYQKALEPIGSARPDWEIFALLSKVPA
jgi:NADH-quinone oxidoreductase subunit G